MTISLEMLIDRTSVEIFADNGRFSVIEPLPEPKNHDGFAFDRGTEMRVHLLEVYELKSIW